MKVFIVGPPYGLSLRAREIFCSSRQAISGVDYVLSSLLLQAVLALLRVNVGRTSPEASRRN